MNKLHRGAIPSIGKFTTFPRNVLNVISSQLETLGDFARMRTLSKTFKAAGAGREAFRNAWMDQVAIVDSGLHIMLGQHRNPEMYNQKAIEKSVIKAIFKVEGHLPMETGEKALAWASIAGRADVAAMLLRRGVDVNSSVLFGLRPLMLAAGRGHAKVVDLLLKNGADVHASDDFQGDTALLRAVEQDHADVVRLLLQNGANAEARDTDGATALLHAARLGDMPGVVGVIRELLKHGSLVNARQSSNEYTALIWAAERGLIAAVRVLLDNHADIHAVGGAGITALINAARYGHASVVRLLLQRGASINAKDADSRTALMLASFYGHLEVVDILLEHGASIITKSRWGETALEIASRMGHGGVYNRLVHEQRSRQMKRKRNAPPANTPPRNSRR